jgi:hypothetical protein
MDIVIKPREEIKTFQDLHIMPLSFQHWMNDYGQFFVERMQLDSKFVMDHDEMDNNDEDN